MKNHAERNIQFTHWAGMPTCGARVVVVGCVLGILALNPALAADDQGIMFSGLWGWMQTLCIWLLDLLRFFARLSGNWGVAIILLALLVRAATYPFARRALLSQKRFNETQQLLAPELAEIRRDFKGGEQAERIIDLYASYKISPAAGMKPLLIVLIQLPVFIGLFQILQRAPELHGAMFLWVNDLSQPDQLATFGVVVPWFGNAINALPIVLAATVVIAALTAPGERHDDASQRRIWISVAIAVAFLAIFYRFPAGLVLYWVMANLLHVAQQIWITVRTKRLPTSA